VSNCKAAIKAVIVPSPPSPMGSKSNVASGSALENPAFIASATLWADKLSLKESGAIKISMA